MFFITSQYFPEKTCSTINHTENSNHVYFYKQNIAPVTHWNHRTNWIPVTV